MKRFLILLGLCGTAAVQAEYTVFDCKEIQLPGIYQMTVKDPDSGATLLQELVLFHQPRENFSSKNLLSKDLFRVAVVSTKATEEENLDHSPEPYFGKDGKTYYENKTGLSLISNSYHPKAPYSFLKLIPYKNGSGESVCQFSFYSVLINATFPLVGADLQPLTGNFLLLIVNHESPTPVVAEMKRITLLK